jgi:hypothetical protein
MSEAREMMENITAAIAHMRALGFNPHGISLSEQDAALLRAEDSTTPMREIP